jgi:hypothetical protein
MKENVKRSVTNITTEADINLISTIHVEKIVEIGVWPTMLQAAKCGAISLPLLPLLIKPKKILHSLPRAAFPLHNPTPGPNGSALTTIINPFFKNISRVI